MKNKRETETPEKAQINANETPPGTFFSPKSYTSRQMLILLSLSLNLILASGQTSTVYNGIPTT